MSRSNRFAPAAAKPSPPSFGRRVAAKVTSLIAKFEALSTGSAPAASAMKEPPPVRSIESVVTYTGSVTQKTLLEKTLGRRAGRLFKQFEKEKDNNLVPPPRVHPPKRKLLSQESRKSRRGSKKDKVEKRLRQALNGSLRWSSSAAEVLVDGKRGYDGPVSDGSDVTESGISTPPVARTLPSSFFAQLVSQDGEAPVSVSKLPTVFAGSNDGEGHMLDPRKFRLPPLPATHRQSVWKRKITPPKISVKELISRFKVTEPKQEDEITPNEESRKSATPSFGSTVERAQSILMYTTPGVQTSANASLSSDSEEVTPKPLKKALLKDPEMRAITGEISNTVLERSISFTLAPPSLTSSQRSSFSTKANENGGVTLIPPSADSKHTNAKKPEVGSSKTDFSSISVRIQAKKGTPQPNKPAATTSYTAPTRLDTPPLPSSSKKYRKTPPPDGFFTKKRIRYSASPSLYTLTSESEGTDSSARTSTTASSSSLRSRHINVSGRSSKSGAITISIGVPAVHIFTPVPVNAVRTIAIRDLVGRF